MKDEQKQTTTTYTDTFTPTSIISDQWGVDEAAELLGWDENENEDDDSDDD